MANLYKYPDSKILIADDDKIMRNVIADLITMDHLVVTSNIFLARNGKEAYEQYLENQPNLVITDAEMPHINGIELIKKIRDLDSDTHVIIITSHADLDFAKEAIKIGIDELISKPFQVDKLLFSVNRSLRSNSIRLENNNMKKRLREAERLSSLGLLSAGVAHEINNPNTYIKGNLELIQKYTDILLPLCDLLDITNNLDKKKIELAKTSIKSTIDTALKGTERIEDIIDGLLSFSRESSSYKEFTSVNNFINDACLLASHKISKYMVNLYVPSDLPDLNINKQELTQVIMNLLVNAADALESQKDDTNSDKHISLNVRHLDDQSKVEIRITDNAGGIPPALLSTIFEPFFTTKPMGKGTGLGLSVSKDNVENNGGTIRCESDVDKDTSFIIELSTAET